MSTPETPFQVLSDDNQGALITLVSVAFLITAIVFVAAKIGSVLYFKQRRTTVNTPIWIALVLSILQVVLMQKAVDHGLGRHIETLKATDVHTASKYIYAAQLIQVLVLSLSKLSTTLLVWKLTPIKGLRRACAITIGLIVAWTLLGLFGLAFQCQLPEPWLYTPDRCAGQGAIWYPVAVLNILTEGIVIAIPFFMMRNVQMASKKRVKILSSFSARACVAGLAIAHLALLPSFLKSTDPTWDFIFVAVCGQAMMCVTVTIACMPTLYHIFAGLNSGLITTRLPDEVELREPKGSAYIYPATGSGSRPGEKKRGSFYADMARFGNIGSSVVTDITTSRYKNAESGRRSSTSESTGSTRHLTQETNQDGVLKTVDITVQVEDGNPRR
ncbi:hypothetical protein FE257_000175 [Aspergillus nanangensis]|uniref:Rhodopsin domain-containing protein n=1 Tax=Aspergillus nanangensis TaxID=2582783 RepID=A0AAD4GZP5_ASPNN|nr:hypothetical protein FE257_000175 [Aspergillus nanangensis]